MSTSEHERLAKDTPVRCAILTISDTRTEATDKSGDIVRRGLEEDGHEILGKQIVPDDPDRIVAVLDHLAGSADVIITSGGTGISRRDSTFEAVSGLLEKTLPGFGEIFRVLSYEEIGPAAMMSRAVAGVYRDTILFATPGSSNAVTLAMDRLIRPQLRHLVWEILRHDA